jgi:hypothetical protein
VRVSKNVDKGTVEEDERKAEKSSREIGENEKWFKNTLRLLQSGTPQKVLLADEDLVRIRDLTERPG